jgi:hypothetical protein
MKTQSCVGEGAQGKPKVRTGEGCPLDLGKMIGAAKNRSETSPLSCLDGEIGDLERVYEIDTPADRDAAELVSPGPLDAAGESGRRTPSGAAG